jgi:hypothetical protein
MFPGRRCRVKPRRWMPSVPRGTSGPPPGGAKIDRGHVRGPNTTLRAIFSRPPRWVDRRPTPVAALRHLPAARSARHAPDLGCGCAASTRVAHESPCGAPGDPATGSSARRCVRSALSVHHLMIGGAASGVPRGTGGRASAAHREPEFYVEHANGRATPGVLPGNREARPCPHPPTTSRTDTGKAAVAGAGLSLCRRGPDVGLQSATTSPSGSPSSIGSRAALRPGHQCSRRPHRAGAPVSSSQADVPALPRLGRRLSGAIGQSDPAAFAARGARPPGGRQGAQESGLARRGGRCPSSRANTAASGYDDVSSMPGGKRGDVPRGTAPPPGSRPASARQPAGDGQNSGRLAGTPSRRGNRSGHGRVRTSDR